MNLLLLIVSGTSLAGFATMLVAYWNARARCEKLTATLAQAARQTADDRTALEKRKNLDTIKDEFISTVSHELRTPLTSIRGALGLLSAGVMGHIDDKAMDLLRIASTNTDRLVRLINDILDLERMDSGRAPLQLNKCSLDELVKQAVETMASMAEAAEVRIVVSSEAPSELSDFDGDPDRMQQVLCNLLSNAIKFSPQNSEVVIATSVDGDDLMLRIVDHGRGVPASKLESIFDRFSQVDASDARQKGGTGLGLAICRSILAQHGGEIWAERNDATGTQQLGTTFLLRIPRMHAATSVMPLPLSPDAAITVIEEDAVDGSATPHPLVGTAKGGVEFG
jgi:signal transduction histidine kinase